MRSLDKSDINKHFLNHFDFKEKNEYLWKLVDTNQNNDIEVNIFLGENKTDNNKSVIVKDNIFSLSSDNLEEITNILKEVYFLILLKKFKYFIKLDQMILLDISDKDKRLFLIFKDNYYPISKIINISNELSDKEKKKIIINNNSLNSFIKSIIYQISFGLYSLHYNSIIHNYMNTNDILLNNLGIISISNLTSMSYKGEASYLCSLYYSPPEFLYNTEMIRDEKEDMWALGVIILELLLKKTNYFKASVQNNDKMTLKEEVLNQLKLIVAKYGIDENIENGKINELINEESKEKYVYQFTKEEKEKINDEKALDLLQNLLTLNPNKRYSAEQVLKSAYLEEYSKVFETDLNYLKNIKKPLDYNKDYKRLFNQEKDKINFKELYDDLYLKLNQLNKYE